MRFSPEFLDEIRARVPVSHVVGRTVSLKRRGREFVGLSPFNAEKTPSFTVNDEKGFFHCFSSQEHGDIFGFVMKTEGVSFADAVERLAGEAGLEVPKATERDRQDAQRRVDVLTALDTAARYFQAQLRSAAGRPALDYLRSRGLDDDAIETFRLGYAPADGQGLLRALAETGIGEAMVLDAGLARRPDDGRAPYAFFRNRVVFPVGDGRDRVVGFGARLLAGDGPKYINSPDGPAFKKGHHLYGLARARRAAHDGQPVIVAEGYMDVIALVRAGFNGAVAPLGTAFTEHQAQLIWRFAREPVLCFDGDAAGRRAAAKAADRLLPLLKPDHTLRIALMPPGQDPDDLIRRDGPQAMAEVLDGAHSLVDLVWEEECTKHRLDTPEGKAGLQAALDVQAGRITDAAVSRFYRAEFRARVEAAFSTARPRDRRGAYTPGRAGSRGGSFAPRPGQAAQAPGLGPRPRRGAGSVNVAPERMVLAIVIREPHRFEPLAEEIAGLTYADPEDQAVHDAVCSALMRAPDLDSSALNNHLALAEMGESIARSLQRVQDHGAGWITADTLDPSQVGAAWDRAWQAIEVQRIEQELLEINRSLRDQPTAAVWARKQALLAQRGQLDDDW